MSPLGTSRILAAARILRGVAQGYLLCTLLPDLHALGYSSLLLGAALSAGLFADFLVVTALGLISDRLSPRALLLSGEILGILSPLPFLISPHPLALAAVLFLAGAGQRSNGSPGPFAPAEQVILSRCPRPERSPFLHYGTNMAAGLAGMATGALLAGLYPRLPAPGISEGMLLLSLLSLLSAGLLLATSPPKSAPSSSPHDAAPPWPRPSPPPPLEPHHRMRLALLVASNLLGGLSLGLVDPLVAAWLLRRFHAAPAEIALLLSLAFGMAAGVAVLLARLPRAPILVRTVVLLQGVSFGAALLLPLAPGLLPAALLYAVRTAFNKAPGGLRQALAATLVPDHRAGLASGAHLASLQAAQVAGPLLAVILWKAGKTDLPLFIAALFSGLSLILFVWLNKTPKPLRETPERSLRQS